MVDRRRFLVGAAAAFAACGSTRVLGRQAPILTGQAVADNVRLLDAGGANVLAASTTDGILLVDSGPVGLPNAAAQRLDGGDVRTVFNTHYHADQIGGNAGFAAMGATVIAHDRTRQWMATDTWIPDEDRYRTARPRAFWPTETFQSTGALDRGAERIEYGHLELAHTSGDIYVFLRTSNVIAVGDVASPLRDPELDYYTGAWIGGRVDSMDRILSLVDDETQIVPAYGPVMTRSEFQAERDLMEEVRERLFTQVREGKGPDEMLAGGLLDGLPRTWQDPYRFLYAAAKGLWAHHNKLNRNVV